jgi:hypothetical protein
MCGRAGRDRGLARRFLLYVCSCVDATTKHSINHVIGVAMSSRQRTFALLKSGSQCSVFDSLSLESPQNDQIITILDFPHLSKLHLSINFGLDIDKRSHIIIIEETTIFHRAGCLQLCNFDLLQKSCPLQKGDWGSAAPVSLSFFTARAHSFLTCIGVFIPFLRGVFRRQFGTVEICIQHTLNFLR